MKIKILLAAAILFGAGISSANAQVSRTPQHDRQRIKQGVRSGELTKAERRRLAHQQKDIHQDIKQAKADGVLTPRERKDIKRDKRRANRSIRRLKHNRRH